MTDVRLTATNPADSSVVPVACNDKGELKLEEPIDFDGNLSGNLTVTGNATFEGETMVGDIYTDGGTRILPRGEVFIRNDNTSTGAFAVYSGGVDIANVKISFLASGDAGFAGSITVDGNGEFKDNLKLSKTSSQTHEFFSCQNDSTNAFIVGSDGSTFIGSANDIVLGSTGAASFAGGNAGITKEGNLYVKTVRGNIVMLDAVSNGLGSWVPYEPPTRKDLLQEKLEDWSEKDKPGISSQESDEI